MNIGDSCTCSHVKQFTAGRPVIPSYNCECDMRRPLPHAYYEYDNVSFVTPADGLADDVLLLDVCAADDYCQCHSPNAAKHTMQTNQHAMKKLSIISIICFIFVSGEFIGGYISGSLAIMTDAAHLLSDLAGFIISLIALWVARKPVTMRMTFGFFRAEILGAVTSVLIIWTLTLVLVYLAIMRCIHRDYEIDADAMLITAGCGVFINILLISILQLSGHGHSHSSSSSEKEKANGPKNLNVRAAFIHCIGDLLQSIGVLVAAVIIKVKPEYKLADPISTFLFSVIVLFTTLSVLRDAMLVLMEAVPRNIDYKILKQELEAIRGVRMAHSLHIWSLTTTCFAMTVHLAVEPGTNGKDVLSTASALINKLGFSFTTIQVEDYIEETMSACRRCIGPC